jgi:hypothetical protein
MGQFRNENFPVERNNRNKKYQNAKTGSSLGLGTHSLRVGFTNLKFSNNAIMQSYIVKVY